MANKFRTKREDPDHRGCRSHITDTYLSFLHMEYSHFLPWIRPGCQLHRALLFLLLVLEHHWNLCQGVSSHGCYRHYQGGSWPPLGCGAHGSSWPSNAAVWGTAGKPCLVRKVLWCGLMSSLWASGFSFTCFDFILLSWTSHSGNSTNN